LYSKRLKPAKIWSKGSGRSEGFDRWPQPWYNRAIRPLSQGSGLIAAITMCAQKARRGNRMKTHILTFVVIALVLVACGPLGPTPVPEDTPTPEPEPTDEPTAEPVEAEVEGGESEPLAAGGTPEELIALGSQQINEGAWAEAEATFREITEMDAGNALAYSALAYIYSQQGMYDEAIVEAKTVVDLMPDEFSNHANLAMLYLQAGQRDEAVTAAEKAVELAPDQERAAVQGYFVQQGLLEAEPVPTLAPGQRAGDLEPAQRDGLYAEPPPMSIDPAKSYQAIIETDNGEIVIELYADQAPNTVNSFVFLAGEGFYDDTTFHRVLPDFMAQGGDPSGTGAGGPGYRFEDEFHPELRHDGPGMLSMANSGPGTNGSQFFITYEATPWLDDAHTVFGRVIEGMEVLQALTPRDPQQSPDFPGDTIVTITIQED
jgi:cyclophilin family peptidyl-prolyl cis-trans isomerase